MESASSHVEEVHEDERLAALDRYDVLDTTPEEAFDRVTRMAQKIFRVPMSAVSFVDGHRQWLKSRHGVSYVESKRCDAICDIAIKQTEPLIICDTTKDARVAENNFVVREPYLRFYAGAQLRSHQGYNVGTLCVMDTEPRKFGVEQTSILVDLANLIVAELDLRLIASTDHLTGALSRRNFKEEAERAKLLALRHGHSLSCIIFDLDHLKKINDAHGHGTGDLVLRRTADACRSALRKSDVFGRIGGEEFGVILPHTAAASANEVAEKIRRAIASLCISAANDSVRVTASFGIAELDGAAPDIDELLRRADEALYASKNSGRNRCSEWRPAVSAPATVTGKVFKAGQIAFNRGSSVIDCTVRGLSDTGAILDVISTEGVPDRFKLRINSNDTSRFCLVRAKRSNRLDVAFG
ncbi:MAG: sensor domain-containing diguanylate cyclase [Pseudomonadota bacterium]